MTARFVRYSDRRGGDRFLNEQHRLLTYIAEKWGMSVEELISYWEKKEPEYGDKLRRLVREHEEALKDQGQGLDKTSL